MNMMSGIFDALTVNARHKYARNVAMEELDTLHSLISIDSLPHEQQATIWKMAVTHSITPMESCFQEMFTAVLFTPASAEYKRNAFEKLTGLKSLKRPLSDILTQEPELFLDDALKAT